MLLPVNIKSTNKRRFIFITKHKNYLIFCIYIYSSHSTDVTYWTAAVKASVTRCHQPTVFHSFLLQQQSPSGHQTNCSLIILSPVYCDSAACRSQGGSLYHFTGKWTNVDFCKPPFLFSSWFLILLFMISQFIACSFHNSIPSKSFKPNVFVPY